MLVQTALDLASAEYSVMCSNAVLQPERTAPHDLTYDLCHIHAPLHDEKGPVWTLRSHCYQTIDGHDTRKNYQ